MAITWGSWDTNSGNAMRVGINVSVGAVKHDSTSCKVTWTIYTENRYRYSDSQSLTISGTGSPANQSYNNSDGGGVKKKRATRTYTYNFGASDYGSGNATTVNITAKVAGAYNGVTPSHSRSVSIPRRPIASPLKPLNVAAVRVSDTAASLTWTRQHTTARPYQSHFLEVWDNVTNAWTRHSPDLGGAATSYSTPAILGANRRFGFRLTAANTAGNSGPVASNFIQTTPAAPSALTATKASTTDILLNWSNTASNVNGYEHDVLLEEQANSGAWTEVAVLPAGTSSHLRSGRSPGTVYAYRVRARSQVGGVLYSSYATSSAIQLQSPPNAPSGLSSFRTNDNSFTFNWTNNPDGELAPYVGVTIQRRDGATLAWKTIANLGPTATTLTDVTTVTNTAYDWRIRAENAAGSSAWVNFDSYQTRPEAPSNAQAKAAPGGALLLTWQNNTGYTNFTTVIRYYKDGVLTGSPVVMAGGESSYLLTGVALESNYRFELQARSAVGYSSESVWVETSEVAAATVPNAPTDLPTGITVDMNFDQYFTWRHNPSLDGSDQTAYEFEISGNDGESWVSLGGKQDGSESVYHWPAGTGANGVTVLARVRTWGVHVDPSPWGAPSVISSSTSPVITLNEPSGPTLPISKIEVDWSYSDAESDPQSFWEIELLTLDGALLERRTGSGGTTNVVLNTAAVDGGSYRLRLQAKAGNGLESNLIERTFEADFVPPALPLLSADYSPTTGVTVLTLTPTPDDGGVTTLPVTSVQVQRRLRDMASGEFNSWETLVENASDAATMVDTTGPIAGDGEYRVVAHSEAPSSMASGPIPPSGEEDRWVYLSGGPNFTNVARLMGNIALRTTTTRDRALHNFAGRSKPVMFVGEATSRVVDVAGLLDGESSSPAEWEELIASSDVLLFRDPLGHRIYGSVPSVSIDFLGNEMYAIAFTVSEVSYP